MQGEAVSAHTSVIVANIMTGVDWMAETKTA